MLSVVIIIIYAMLSVVIIIIYAVVIIIIYAVSSVVIIIIYAVSSVVIIIIYAMSSVVIIIIYAVLPVVIRIIYADRFSVFVLVVAAGPATVRMVSNNGPPLPMPMQVPPGHMVQQIVDEYGILTHVILSPQPPVPGSPMTVHFISNFLFLFAYFYEHTVTEQ